MSEPELITEEGLDAMIAGLALPDDPAVVEGLLRCRECGGSLALQRSDSRHRSDRCRLRAWRKRKRSAPGLWPLYLGDEGEQVGGGAWATIRAHE